MSTAAHLIELKHAVFVLKRTVADLVDARDTLSEALGVTSAQRDGLLEDMDTLESALELARARADTAETLARQLGHELAEAKARLAAEGRAEGGASASA